MSDYDQYLGKRYELGQEDCYGCVRRYLDDIFDIQLPNFARPEGFHNDEFFNFYQMHEDWGFSLVCDKAPRPGDVFLIKLSGGAFSSHCAIMVDGHMILHHLPNTVSRLDRLRPRWIGRVTHHLRHPKTEPPPLEPVNYHEIAQAHVFQDRDFQKGLSRALETGS